MTSTLTLSAEETQQVLQQALDASRAIAGSAAKTVEGGQYVFFAAFDGTDNAYVPVNGDTQNTAIAQLRDQVSLNGKQGVGYYAGVGTPGTLGGSDWYPPDVTAQSIQTARDAYDGFALGAFIWLQAHPGGSVTSMIAGFSRGCASEAIFAQMLYENGLVFKDVAGVVHTLIPPGTVGAVSAALAIDPVLTGELGNMDFPPGVLNLAVVRAENEYRSAFKAVDYGDDNESIVSVPGNHSDAGDAYDNGLGGMYLTAYTTFFQRAGLDIALPIPSRSYMDGNPIVIHSESLTGSALLTKPWEVTYNPSNDLSVTRATDTYGAPVSSVENASVFVAYNGDYVVGGSGYSIDTEATSAPAWVLLPDSSAHIAKLGGTNASIRLTQNDTLELSPNLAFDKTTFAFPTGNTIDVPGIPIASGALSSTNVLTVSGQTVPPVALVLDRNVYYYPGGSFAPAPESFLLAPDGTGGTNVISVDDRQAITFTGANETLLVTDPSRLVGTVSRFTQGDTIDLAGISATGVTLSSPNVLTVQKSGGGTLGLNVASVEDDQGFAAVPDGVGGTDVLIGPFADMILTGTFVGTVSYQFSLIASYTIASGQYVFSHTESRAIVEQMVVRSDPAGVGVDISLTPISEILRGLIVEPHLHQSLPLYFNGPVKGGQRTFSGVTNPDFNIPILNNGRGESIILDLGSKSVNEGITIIEYYNPVPSTIYGPNTNPAQVSGGGILYLQSPACFVMGTHIATLRGQFPVERVQVGDIMTTLFEGAARVRWVGRRHIDCRRHPKPQKVWPVRVLAGAFGTCMPKRNLWLSPDHAVLADGVLIPIKHLVNGTTIEQVPMDEVTYYHVELSRHDVLYAEGVPAESYLDTGDRANFEYGSGMVALHPDFGALRWEAEGCAPLIVTGPKLQAVRRRVNARAVLLRREPEPCALYAV